MKLVNNQFINYNMQQLFLNFYLGLSVLFRIFAAIIPTYKSYMNHMTAMKKTLRLWMLLVVTLNIASCVDLNDNPVVYGPLDEVLAANECFSDIKENPDTSAMKKKEKGELEYLSQYSMYILQPVNHDQPDGDKFKQKIGPNVKKIINPIGMHGSIINDPEYCPAEVKEEVMDFICRYIY